MNPTPTDRKTRYAFRKGAPTVTGIVGMLEKGGLAPGAAAETARFALKHPEEYVGLEYDEAYDRVRKHYLGVWGDRARIGTETHAVIEAWARGQNAEVSAETQPFVDAFCAFFEDWQPEFHEIERVVDYENPTRPYVGTFDAVATLVDGRSWLLDWKSVGHETNIYTRDWTMQGVAYRFASRMAIFAEDGTVHGWEPLPKIDAVGAVALRADSSYELYELPATRDAFGEFLRLVDVWYWQRDHGRWARTASPKEPPGSLEPALAASLEAVAS